MDENYLELVLSNLKTNQANLKNELKNAIHISEDEEDKKRLQSLLNFSVQIEEAIENKDLELLQKLYSNAGNY